MNWKIKTMKVNMKLHIEMLLQCLEKSELWKYIAFGPETQTNHGTRMIQQRFLIELCALLGQGSGNSVTSVWLINTELMGRREQQINHSDIFQNTAHESSSCTASRKTSSLDPRRAKDGKSAASCGTLFHS